MAETEAETSDLELCIICMNSFIADPEGTYIRQVCNHPTEKHYCCIECLEKYEAKHQERCARERTYLTMYMANVYPSQYFPMATYGNTQCPCYGCYHSFHPVRDGPTRLFHTKREGKMPEGCIFQAHGKTKMTNYMCSNSLSKEIRANIEMYEIANFKEGRLDGKYVIIHLYKKILPEKTPMDPWTSESYAKMRPTAIVAMITFKNGMIESMEEYVSLKHRQISEYMEELYQSRFSKSSDSITPDRIYQELRGDIKDDDSLLPSADLWSAKKVDKINPYHLAQITGYRYEMNVPSFTQRNILIYETSSIHYYDRQKVPPSPDFQQGYYSRAIEIYEKSPYITPEILKKMEIKRENPDGPLISNHPFKTDYPFSYLKTKRIQYNLVKNSEELFVETKMNYLVENEYKIISNLETNPDIMWNTSYYGNGEIHCRQRYKSSSAQGYMVQDGPEIYYYDNGNVKMITQYVKGKKEGHLFDYNRNTGAITGYAFYEKGKRTLLFQG